MNYVDENVDPAMPSGMFFVLYRLANRATDHSREDWSCYPAVETQAEDTHLSRSAVERHLTALVSEGWISRKRRVRADGKLGFYDYWIHRTTERRAALKEARRRIREAGDKVTETLADLDHPCGKSPHGPCGDLDPAMRQFGAEPCGDLPHQLTQREHSDEPATGAREDRVREYGDEGFDKLVAVWQPSGLKRTKYPRARAAFALAAQQVGSAPLIAAGERCAADPEYAARTWGWPSLQDWLSDEQWRPFLADPAKNEAPASRTAFAGPPELRAAIVADPGLGEGFAGSFLDRSAWDDGERELRPWSQEAARRLASQAAHHLRACRVTLNTGGNS